jgi:hypothetical protein
VGPIVAYLATAVTSDRTHAVPPALVTGPAETPTHQPKVKGRTFCGIPAYIESRNDQPVPVTANRRPDCLTCRRAVRSVGGNRPSHAR